MQCHGALIMLDDLESQIPLGKVVQELEELIFLDIVGERHAVFYRVKKGGSGFNVLFFH